MNTYRFLDVSFRGFLFVFCFVFYFNIVLPTPYAIWDLSSLTRDRTHVLFTGNTES